MNFTPGMNKFGHFKNSERPRLFMTQNKLQGHQDMNPVYAEEYLPNEYDWKKDGVRTIESQFEIHIGYLPNLNEQEIVSCLKVYGNLGAKEDFLKKYSNTT
ncbi:hypothetical protein MXB_2953 [Myxobolus squamalis]|nr:hypothetical protein MXB_2953 [Myxobolus squamalis]